MMMTETARRLKLTWAHLVVVGVLWLASAAVTVTGCLNYNRIAGTDKTPRHITIIAGSMPMGPLAGHVANPSGGFRYGLRWFLILCPVPLLALCPFLFVRREVPLKTLVAAWIGFVAGMTFWFFSSVVSVGIYLS